MKRDAVNWTKVTLDPSELLLKNQMVKSGIEFANSGRSRRDVHCFLTSAKHQL